jgi:hypothetical protein
LRPRTRQTWCAAGRTIAGRTRECAGPRRWASARAAAAFGANLVVSYFAMRSFENIESIIKR